MPGPFFVSWYNYSMTNLETLNKTKLLGICSNLELAVSTTSTKAELIAAIAETKLEVTPFVEMERDDLIAVATEFGVDHNPLADTKLELLRALDQDGVEYSLYKATHPDAPVDENVEVAAVVVEDIPTLPVNRQLVKMTRKNASLEFRGVKFTRENPYGMLSEDDAEYAINVFGGFVPVTQREFEAYYA
jgi:hypothetical protein